jgi:hypothetical protein
MNAVNRFALPLCLLALLPGAVGYSQNVNVNWYSFNGGFAVTSGPNTVVESSVGQVAIGSAHQSNNFLESGFLANPLLRGLLVNVGENKEFPFSCSLSQNYPNPFNPTTKIGFGVWGLGSTEVRLCVYDLLGREVAVMVDEKKDAGFYEVKLDGSNLASGVYFYRLQVGDFVSTKKLLILR